MHLCVRSTSKPHQNDLMKLNCLNPMTNTVFIFELLQCYLKAQGTLFPQQLLARLFPLSRKHVGSTMFRYATTALSVKCSVRAHEPPESELVLPDSRRHNERDRTLQLNHVNSTPSYSYTVQNFQSLVVQAATQTRCHLLESKTCLPLTTVLFLI